MNLPPRIADVPPPVLGLCHTLAAHGHGAWVVGGCVRDRLMGREANDWDVCTTALPKDLIKIFPRAIPTGIEHGTITVVVNHVHYEVTTLRGEATYTDGRRPDAVYFHDDVTLDLARRDFTVNAIAYDPLTDVLVDPFGGEEDIARRLLRAVGDASARFNEDGLRILRGARFVAALDFDLDPATEAAMETALDVFRKVSAERVRDEWCKTLKTRAPSRAFEVMRRRGILAITLPELPTAADRWQPTMAAVDAAPRERPNVRLAALLKDMGVATAEAWLKDYRYSNEERERIVHLIRHREPGYETTWNDAKLRRWLKTVGIAALDEVFALMHACLPANDIGNMALLHFRSRLDAMVAAGVPLSTRDLRVSGSDLMSELGLKPSKRLGEILAALLERVLDDPTLNDRERLLSIARDLMA